MSTQSIDRLYDPVASPASLFALSLPSTPNCPGTKINAILGPDANLAPELDVVSDS